MIEKTCQKEQNSEIKKTQRTFIDLKKAFDTVEYKLYYKNLTHMVFKDLLWNIWNPM